MNREIKWLSQRLSRFSFCGAATFLFGETGKRAQLRNFFGKIRPHAQNATIMVVNCGFIEFILQPYDGILKAYEDTEENNMENNKRKFGDLCKSIRGEKLGITQEQMAERLNVAPNTVASWEQGKTMPRCEQLRSFAKLADMEFEELYRQIHCCVTDEVKEESTTDDMFADIPSFPPGMHPLVEAAANDCVLSEKEKSVLTEAMIGRGYLIRDEDGNVRVNYEDAEHMTKLEDYDAFDHGFMTRYTYDEYSYQLRFGSRLVHDLAKYVFVINEKYLYEHGGPKEVKNTLKDIAMKVRLLPQQWLLDSLTINPWSTGHLDIRKASPYAMSMLADDIVPCFNDESNLIPDIKVYDAVNIAQYLKENGGEVRVAVHYASGKEERTFWEFPGDMPYPLKKHLHIIHTNRYVRKKLLFSAGEAEETDMDALEEETFGNSERPKYNTNFENPAYLNVTESLFIYGTPATFFNTFDIAQRPLKYSVSGTNEYDTSAVLMETYLVLSEEGEKLLKWYDKYCAYCDKVANEFRECEKQAVQRRLEEILEAERNEQKEDA